MIPTAASIHHRVWRQPGAVHQRVRAVVLVWVTLLLAACAPTAGQTSAAATATTAAALDRLSLYVGNGALCRDCRAGAPYRIFALDAATGAIRRTYGHDTDLAFSSAPLAQNGVLYAATLQHELVALTLSDGTVRWRRPLTLTGVFEMPVLAEGLLLVVEEQSSNQAPVLASRLDAFDAATGELRWSRAGGSDYLHLLAPRVRDGVVYIAFDDALSALRLRDGATLWRAALPHRTNGRAAVDEKGQVYLTWQNALTPGAPFSGFPTGYVAALRAPDGAVVWRSEPIEDVVPGGESPQVAEGLVYGVTRGRVYVLDAATGHQLWRYPEQLPDLFLGVRGAVLAGGVVDLSLNSGVYVALDARTGAERWRTASLFDVDPGVGVNRGLAPDQPLVAGDVLYSEFAGSGIGGLGPGVMVALDTRTGALRWHTPLKGALYPAFSLAR